MSDRLRITKAPFRCPHCHHEIAGLQSWTVALQQRWASVSQTGSMELNYFRGQIANANVKYGIDVRNSEPGAAMPTTSSTEGSGQSVR